MDLPRAESKSFMIRIGMMGASGTLYFVTGLTDRSTGVLFDRVRLYA